MTVAGKVAVITGASSGIGEAIARRLAAAGATLVLTARREDRLRQLQAELKVESAILVADVAAPDTAGKLLALAKAQFGRADILINNAGFLSIRPLETIDLDIAAEMIRVNFEAVVRNSYTFASEFKQQHSGAIINVSSIGAFMNVPMGGVYSGVKAAVERFSAALRIELAGTGVRVGSIAPGTTATEVLDAARNRGEQPWQQDIVELRAGDIANAVLFMLEQPAQANIAGLQIYSSAESA
jgi:NADP-dependent 3-hydroxy acid dehydrogenase YdfG